jgi:rhodanese-related sulfurtransferase
MKNSESLALEIDVHSARLLMDQAQELLLIDCRETFEYEICRIEGSTLIPMRELPARVGEIHSHVDKPVVVYCHHGVRSLHVVQWLRQSGFGQAQSVSGGIDEWSRQIDPGLSRY